MDSTSSFSKLQSTLGSADSAFNPVEALGQNTALSTATPSLLAPRASLLFIDSTVADYQSLVAGAVAGTEVHLLNSAQDAVSQITNTLLGREGISSIHIVSHGQSGGLNFANGLFNLSSLPEYAAQIQSWSQALTDDADILLYGCNVAEGELGQAFVQILSQLSGADVAASDDLTGNSTLGGDWNLEVATGAIESSSAFDAGALSSYNGVLDYTLGARHAVSGGDVFLGGQYIELGIRGNAGFFGTSASKPANFFGTSARSNVGLSIDPDSYQTGSTFSYDIFLPGTPYEGWAIGYAQSGTPYSLQNAGGASTQITSTTVDTSSGNTLAATVTSNTAQNISVVQTYSFDYTEDYWKTAVTITNNSATAIDNLRYSRGYDPDTAVDGGGTTNTTNTIVNTIATDGNVIVSAQVPNSDPSFATYGARPSYFVSFDPSARAFLSPSLFSPNINTLSAGAKGATVTADNGVVLWFDLGTLAAGASKTFQFYTGLSTKILTAAANAPTNTVPTAQTISEDTPFTFSGSNAISVGDPDSTNLTVTLTAANGTITLGGTGGLSFASGDGTTDSTMTFTGAKTAINTALNNLVFNPTANFSGAANLQIITSDGDFSDADTVNITVNAVDDPSVLAVSGNLNFTEDGSAIVVAPGLTISDPDGMSGARVSIANPGVGDALGIQGQSGTSGTISGINWSYDNTTGILTFSGTASAATYESVLRQVTYSNSSQAPTPGDRNIQFSLGSVLSNPGNNHFYEFVSAPNISWTAAQTAAASRRLFGLQGYLATVTSASEQAFVESKLNGQGWMGANDAVTEGDWRWVTGPEGLANGGTGTPFWSGLGIGGAPVGGQYNNWDAGEPNDAPAVGGEDYAHFLDDGRWNDYPVSLSSITGYVVEYGGMPGDPSLQTTGNVTITVAGVNDPSTGNITIPTTVQEGQQVTANTSGFSDPDGIVSFSYQWQQSTDGVSWTNIVGATNVNFTPGNTQVGQRLRVQVSYTDGGGTAEGPILSNATTSGVVNVNNSPTGNVVISGTVQEDQQLTADTSGLSDADGLGTFSYQWQQSTDGVNWTSITGATNVNFTPGDAQVGQRLRVQVSYTDGDGTSEGPISSTATTSAVSNINDVLTGTVTISGTVQEDQQLTADTSGLSDGDGIGTFSYQWQQSTDGVNWTSITGATNVNFTPGDAQVGQQLRVQVSHTDARGTTEGPISSSATSLTTGINDAPTLNAPANITVTENTATSITGITFNDVDAGTGSLTATFSIPAGSLTATSGNGVTVGGTATNLTLSGTLAAINAFITAGSLKYTTATNSLTAQTLNVIINDNGTGGTGGSLTANTTINLPVTPQPPAVSVSNVSHSEGTRGNKTYTFTVALSKASNQPITISYATADGTAKVSDNDYVTANGSLTFNPGDPLTKTFTVTVNGDSKLEATENFQISLSLVSGTATIANNTTLGIIGDDDGNGIDINLDGTVDSFWRSPSDSASGIWFMNSTSIASTAALPSVNSDWRMEETGDFNDDGIDDFFWHNIRTGQTGIWLMNQAGGIASIVSSLTVSADWKLEKVGDFDGDNQVDMLWRNASTGDNGIWLMNGTTYRSSVALVKADSNWEIAAVGDFDGDQDLDILWRNTVTGANGIWNLNNTSFGSATALASAAPGWTVADVADLDADGDLDILWHNTNTADVGIWQMNNGTVAPGGYLALPRLMSDPGWRIRGIIDVEGDGKLEIFWRHLTLGSNGIWRMNSVNYSGNAAVPSAAPSWSTYIEG